MARDAFTFFASFRTATAKLDDATRLAVYDAIMDYALFDEEPEFDNVVAEAIFTLVRPNVDASNKKRDSGAKGGSSVNAEKLESTQQALDKQSASKAEALDKQTASTQQANSKHPASDKDKDIDKDIDINPPYIVPPRGKEKFRAPTVEDVRSYCQQRGNSVDPQSFVAFYASKGWKVGNQPMKDWKQAVITWERKDARGGKTRGKPAHLNYAQHTDSTFSLDDIAVNLDEIEINGVAL